jgi:predicted HAD superfamily Cof-like phosphohydrolase
VTAMSSRTSEEMRAYFRATRLRRTRAYFNVESLVAAQKSASPSDDDDELSGSDQSETLERINRAEGSSPAVG